MEQLSWFKSTYSSGEGGHCLEVAYTSRKSSHSSGEGGECPEVACDWRKSSHSMGDGQCLEVAAHPAAVHVRDSKQPAAAQLTVGPSAWSAFLAGEKERLRG